ncbi:MAG: type II toxin-antitoxin system RelE/ParE family toxin, partial [Elstera sp.]
NPEAGAVIKDTGGARKLRWARAGGGKSGGVRTIYYFHCPDVSLVLLTVYGKGTKANLSAQDKSAISRAIESLKARFRAGE